MARREPWHVGFSTYLASYEVRLHRRQDTFGGRLWPDPHAGLLTEHQQLQIALTSLERKATA